MSERLAKFIARSGVCSRRAAEELILQKRITAVSYTHLTLPTTERV